MRNVPSPTIEALPYHVELRDYLKSCEPDLWRWFASARAQADYTENLRLELLKSTYRLDAEGHPELYETAAEAKAKLDLDIPLTLYQAQNSPQLNAALYYVPGEGHIVFSGPVLTLLSTDELKSVIGHELAHHHLWGRDDGEFHIADRLLLAVANDPRAAAAHEQAARWFTLYTEIFADRGSLCVTGDINPVVAGLVKIETGIAQVSAPGYLKQAAEIFEKGNTATQGLTHPETFIRARALALWQEEPKSAAAEITRMIEGVTSFDQLDVIGQARLAAATQTLLQRLLQPKWFQTPPVLGHAKNFFDGFAPVGAAAPEVPHLLKADDAKLRDYLCYLLMDFVTVDPELDQMPLAAALEMSRELEIETQFDKVVTKELSIKARELKKLKERAAFMLTAEAAAN